MSNVEKKVLDVCFHLFSIKLRQHFIPVFHDVFSVGEFN